MLKAIIASRVVLDSKTTSIAVRVGAVTAVESKINKKKHFQATRISQSARLLTDEQRARDERHMMRR